MFTNYCCINVGMHYIFMRFNLKEFGNQKAFSAFVGFTIKTLSTRSYVMAEALEMHLLKKFGINEMFRIDVFV
jgi:hypothetical protein